MLNLFYFFDSSFIPPITTRDNAQKWYNQGYDIVNIIVNKRQELVEEINEIINNEIDLLKKESEIIRVKEKQTMKEGWNKNVYYLFNLIGKNSS